MIDYYHKLIDNYSLHQNISFKRAFNPILGETYEGFFVVDENEIERDWNLGRGISITFDVKQPENTDEESDEELEIKHHRQKTQYNTVNKN